MKYRRPFCLFFLLLLLLELLLGAQAVDRKPPFHFIFLNYKVHIYSNIHSYLEGGNLSHVSTAKSSSHFGEND